MPRVLLVDDEENLRLSLGFTLGKEGFEVLTAADGVTALELVRSERPDVVILDLMLPGVSGMEVCRWIRSVSNVPVLMLTAMGEVEDKVAGLRTGADDYVTKPFSTRELTARVRALVRRDERARSAAAAAARFGTSSLQPAELGVPQLGADPLGRSAPVLESSRSGIIEAGPVRMDLDRHEAWVSDQPLNLTPKEFHLLQLLLSYRGRVLSRESLIATVWGDEFMGGARTLDVHIYSLRSKIELEPGEPRHLVTLRGLGFRFD